MERTREKVAIGTRTHKKTGEIKPVLAWRAVKTVLASITTRLGEWTMAPRKNLAHAVQLAQARLLVQLDEGSPAQLGVLAVRAFWSAMWDGVALKGAEPPPPESLPAPLPWLLATA